ncbi:MAG: xanthine dehydrogenase family protein molybdopterin-binding subunit [Chloroflexota bacterium]
MAAERFFGQRVRRFEDPRLLRGEGAFIEDLQLDGVLHAAFVRSPYAHARIVQVATQPALDVGAIAVFTAADLLEHPIPTVVPHPAYRGCNQPSLAREAVRFVGEAFAVVVAPDRYTAEDAAGAILAESEFEPLDVVADSQSAIEDGAPRIHPSLPDNVSGDWVVEVGDVDDAFAHAAHVVSGRFSVQRYTGMPMECRGVLAAVDPVSDRLTIWSSTQWPHTVRGALASALELPEHQIRVIAPDLGGGFGVKQDIYPEEIVLPQVARTLRRPVKWVETRREHFTGTAHSREQIHDVELALDADGVVTALRADVLADLGAYSRGLSVLCPSITSGSLLGPYRVTNYRARIRCAITNKAPAGAYRGAGGPEAVFALERAIDRAAEALAIDPAELRRRNFIRPDEFPWNTGLGSAQVPIIYDSGEYEAGLDQALDLGHYAEWRQRQAEARADGRYLGIGVVPYVLLGGLGPYESAEARVDSSGQVVVVTGAHAHGQGTDTALAQIVADELGIQPAQITVRHGDTDQIPFGVGTYASRNAVTAGSATAVASRIVREKALKLAAMLLETSPADLELADGTARVKGTPDRSVTLGALARAAEPQQKLPDGMEPGLEGRHYFQAPLPTFSSGCCLAVVEVWPDTGRIEILDYVSVNDAGPLINPTIVDAQIQGGLAQGLGGALFEEIIYDQEGQPASSFLDYAIPRATDVPDVRQAHRYTRSPLNPLGVKGLGEGGSLAPPPLLAAAVEDALRPLGVRIDRTPITPGVIWRLCRERLSAREDTA